MKKLTQSFTIFALFLLSHEFPSTVQAQYESVAKVLFEQKTQHLIWDVGSNPGLVDQSDNRTDINLDCAITDSSIVLNPETILAKKNFSPLRLEETVNKILGKFRMRSDLFKMNPVSAFIGENSKPTFMIFPELHLNNPISEKLGNLHASTAQDMLKMTAVLDSQNVGMVNTVEGPQGDWKSQFGLNPKDFNERVQVAFELMAKNWISGGHLIGEVYSDKVLTQYHDDNDLAIKYVLTLKAYAMSLEVKPVSSEDRWLRAQQYLLEKFPVRASKVKVGSYKTFFMNLLRNNTKKIKSLNTKLCEERSREMADFSFNLAKNQNAQVVFLSFGALHTHGAIERLKKIKASYIVFSPNF